MAALSMQTVRRLAASVLDCACRFCFARSYLPMASLCLPALCRSLPRFFRAAADFSSSIEAPEAADSGDGGGAAPMFVAMRCMLARSSGLMLATMRCMSAICCGDMLAIICCACCIICTHSAVCERAGVHEHPQRTAVPRRYVCLGRGHFT